MADYDAANITDSTDWLGTPLSGLSPVESALRCRVCRDFYKTPMLTTCLHTFCSLCIRRSLANDGRCPACRAPEQESKLRWNGALDEAVDAYAKARPTVLSLARAGVEESRHSPKRKLEHEASQDSGEDTSRKRLRSSARLNRALSEDVTAEVVRQEVEVIEDSADEDYEENQGDDTLTACPICGRRMKEYLVFGHLDKCTGPTGTSQTSSQGATAPGKFLNSSPRKQQTKLERLPAVNYSTLKDQALRKKMTELGISSAGSRLLLERRHREWRTIWNANCDAVKPRPRAQLVHDLEVWERTQGGRVSAISRLGQNTLLVKDKDFDGGAWATKYNSSFKDLVANARRGRPLKQEPGRVEGGQKEHDSSVGVDDYEHRESDAPTSDASINRRERLDFPVDDASYHQKPVDRPVDGASGSQQKAVDPPMDNVGSMNNTSVVKNAGSHDQKAFDVPVNNVAS